MPRPVLIAAFLSAATAARADSLHVPADFGTVQAAITAAAAGDEVVLAPGLHAGPIDLGGKAITLRSTDPADPAVVDATILDGGGGGTVVACRTGEGRGTVIDGITITGGDGDSGGAGINGGGLHVDGSAPTIRRCRFTGNTAFGGGAMLIESGQPLLDRCRFIGNTAESLAGAVYVRFIGDPVIVDCLFEDNQAVFRAGALLYSTSNGPVTRCVFRNNVTDEESGAVHIKSFSDPQFTDCTFEGNVAATEPGGAVRVENLCGPSFTTCVFSSNSASVGGAIFNNAGSTTAIAGSTFCGNSPDAIGGKYADGGGNAFPAACPGVCPADATGDGVVNVDDLVAVVVGWGTDGSANGGDVTADGLVDVNDLVAVISGWGPCSR